jgi:hypothetical protein
VPSHQGLAALPAALLALVQVVGLEQVVGFGIPAQAH